MTNLGLTQAKWIELFDRLRYDPEIDAEKIAPPFVSVPAIEARSILYVGKATSKDGPSGDLPPASGKQSLQERVNERRECTKQFLTNIARCYDSGFWRFAEKLNAVAASKWKPSVKTPLQYIVWTNVCKIGTLKGNPKGHLFDEQRSLAVETLRLEIELYRPQLICFVTWNYKWDLVKEVICDPSDASWDQTDNQQWIWWRRAKGTLPAILLTGHPQGKQAHYLGTWLERASQLLPD
jgi:hypothetical protein